MFFVTFTPDGNHFSVVDDVDLVRGHQNASAYIMAKKDHPLCSKVELVLFVSHSHDEASEFCSKLQAIRDKDGE